MKEIYVVSFSGVETRRLLAVAGSLSKILEPEIRVASVNAPAPGRARQLGQVLDNTRRLFFPQALRLLLLMELGSEFPPYHIEDKSLLVNLSSLEHFQERVAFDRLCKSSLYALSLSFGLETCEESNCLMKGFSSLPQLDSLGSLCDACRRELNSICIRESY